MVNVVILESILVLNPKNFLRIINWSQSWENNVSIFFIDFLSTTYTLTNRIKGSKEYIAALRPDDSSLKTK